MIATPSLLRFGLQAFGGLLTLLAGGCAAPPEPEPVVAAAAATDPGEVRVRVSLQHRAVYVVEGERPLLVTAVAIGKPESPTPTGSFRVYRKEAGKRSNTYGFHVNGDDIRSGKRADTPRGFRYVGFPMPYWVEFSPGYGFHAGSVWPTPRSHGCLRIHPDVAPRFFSLVPRNAPVYIAHNLPEDVTLGKNLVRPTDYADPDPPRTYLISDAALVDLLGKRLRN